MLQDLKELFARDDASELVMETIGGVCAIILMITAVCYLMLALASTGGSI